MSRLTKTGLLGQGHEVSLKASDLVFQAVVQINLVQVPANAQEHPARTDWPKVIIPDAVIALEQVLDTVGLGQELSAVEDVDIDFGCRVLITTNEMPRETYPCYGKLQAPGQQKVNQA